MTVRAIRRTSALLALVLLAVSSGRQTTAQALPPTITSYILVSQVPFARTGWEYTSRAVLSNPGAALAGATATVVSSAPDTVVVDGAVSFGPVASGGTVTSTDTFSLRQNRLVPFKPASLVWTVNPVVANRPPSPVIAPFIEPILVRSIVLLDGSGSSDADGDALSFSWAVSAKPAGSSASLIATTAQTSLSPESARDL